MTKLEKAAQAHVRALAVAENVEQDFIAGARWALEQMTTDACVNAYRLTRITSLSCGVAGGLAAVRKEIES